VPIDDEKLHGVVLHAPSDQAAQRARTRDDAHGGGIHVKLLPGSFRPVVNRDNDYMIDRVAQKHHRSYSGVKGIAMQDAAIQESTGPIQDRSKENLVSTDNGVIMARQRLRKAALGLMQGNIPDGIDPLRGNRPA
jgi:phthalate 4,5-dioxygenase